MNNTLANQEIAFEKNSAYELRKFGPQPNTECTAAHEKISAEREGLEGHHPVPVCANVDF